MAVAKGQSESEPKSGQAQPDPIFLPSEHLLTHQMVVAENNFYMPILPTVGFGVMVILIFIQTRAINIWFRKARDRIGKELGNEHSFEAFRFAIAVLVFPDSAWRKVQNVRLAKAMKDCGAHWRGRIPPIALMGITLIGGLLAIVALLFIEHIMFRTGTTWSAF